MDEPTPSAEPVLTRQEISTAITGLGWRLILGALQTYVPVTSLAEAVRVVADVADATGTQADQSLRADVRSDRVVLTLRSFATGQVTSREIDLAHRISMLASGLGLATSADGAAPEPARAPAAAAAEAPETTVVPDTTGVPEMAGVPETTEAPGAAQEPRTVQGLEIGIDALDIPAIRPFWRAVLGYVDEPGQDGPPNGLVDPVGQGPAIWFQQMDAPRPQRNRIHFDVSVPHDEAAGRIAATLAAGGRLTYDEAPAFWVLADPEGNEACVCTWQGRD
jgi:4a-hydroxytetrahydrobiopterin dehydratase